MMLVLPTTEADSEQQPKITTSFSFVFYYYKYHITINTFLFLLLFFFTIHINLWIKPNHRQWRIITTSGFDTQGWIQSTADFFP